jgi:plastocyanin
MTRTIHFGLLLLLFAVSPSYAGHFDIYFGGENGSPAFGYSPSSLTVNVGDTIVWHGDFTMHPLASFALPDGAAAIQNSTGTSYSYVVSTAGTYRYRCLAHSTPDGQGMSGMFSAGVAGVNETPSSVTSLSQPYPNPATESGPTMLHIVLEKRTHLRLDIFDERGQQVLTVLDEDRNAGMHMLTIDASKLAAGSYSYVLRTPESVMRRGLVVTK